MGVATLKLVDGYIQVRAKADRVLAVAEIAGGALMLQKIFSGGDHGIKA